MYTRTVFFGFCLQNIEQMVLQNRRGTKKVSSGKRTLVEKSTSGNSFVMFSRTAFRDLN